MFQIKYVVFKQKSYLEGLNSKSAWYWYSTQFWGGPEYCTAIHIYHVYICLITCFKRDIIYARKNPGVTKWLHST